MPPRPAPQPLPATFPRRAAWPLCFIALCVAHLLAGHALARGTHGPFVRLILYPLFLAARPSTRLTRLLHSHGGWPAAVAESILFAAIAVLAASRLARARR